MKVRRGRRQVGSHTICTRAFDISGAEEWFSLLPGIVIQGEHVNHEVDQERSPVRASVQVS